jgi:outer membrane protein assembly factor BamD (BamD/ComL family)
MIVRMKQDPELVDLVKNVPKKILMYYNKMFQFYTKGDWKKAKKGLNKILKRKKDGPSLFLIEVMKEYSYKPPKWWKGIRVID